MSHEAKTLCEWCDELLQAIGLPKEKPNALPTLILQRAVRMMIDQLLKNASSADAFKFHMQVDEGDVWNREPDSLNLNAELTATSLVLEVTKRKLQAAYLLPGAHDIISKQLTAKQVYEMSGINPDEEAFDSLEDFDWL